MTNEGTSYFGDSICAPSFQPVHRFITGHRSDGCAHFLIDDNGSHHSIRNIGHGDGAEAAETILYSTFGSPVNITDDDDVHAADKMFPGQDPLSVPELLYCRFACHCQ